MERVLALLYVYPFRCPRCGHRFRARQWGARYVREERREYERVSTRLPVTIVWKGREVGGLVTDLSVAGCSVQMDSRLPVGESLQLRFTAAGEAVGLSVDVVLVRSTRPDGVGLEFAEVQQEQAERLARLVRDLVDRMRQG